MELSNKLQSLKFNFTRACVAASCKLLGGDPAAPGYGTLLGTAFRNLLSQLEPPPALVPIPIRSFEPQSVDSGFHSRFG